MKKAIGLWIDHREAVLVTLTEKGEETRRMDSGMEKHVRFSGGAEQVTNEDIRDRRFANHLNTYYAAVVASIRDADSILIFGPGEAKGELAKRLESENLTERIVGIETVDKMTERQIGARVRKYFHR
jgi:S-adenosylmethionine:diacylglycerol 3-amino-3-carboxypropyl transferase